MAKFYKNQNFIDVTSQPSNGIDLFDRRMASSSLSMNSGIMRVTFFTANKSMLVSQVTIATNNTAAAPTPSLVQIGLFGVDANGLLLTEMITSTPNDTALLAATFTVYTKSFSASANLIEGTRYALGLLVVTAAAVPNVLTSGQTSGANSLLISSSALPPRLGGSYTTSGYMPSVFPIDISGTQTAGPWARLS